MTVSKCPRSGAWMALLVLAMSFCLGGALGNARAGQARERLVVALGHPSRIYAPESWGNPGLQPLTSPASGEDVEPVTAPDRNVVAFARIGASDASQDGIWLLMKNHTLRQLTRGFSDSEPAWAPNGRTVAFLRSQGGSASQVMVVARSGGAPTMLTRDGLAKAQLTWSPDGHWLAYVGESQAPTPRIYAVSAQTKRVKTLSRAGTIVGAPAWAPTLNRLAYVIVGRKRVRIVALNVRSGKVDTVRTLGGQVVVDDVVWAPSGRALAFTLAHRGSILRSVYLTSATGAGRVAKLERSRADDNWPVWSPDGSTIAVSRIAGNTHARLQAVVMRISDGRVLWASPRLPSDFNSGPTTAWLQMSLKR